MDIAIGFLTFGTLGFVLVFAYVEARVTQRRLDKLRADRARAAAEAAAPAA